MCIYTAVLIFGCITRKKMAASSEHEISQQSCKKLNVSVIKEKAKQFIDNKIYSNNYVELIAHLEDENVRIVLASMKAVCDISLHLINTGELFEKKIEREQDPMPEEVFHAWLRSRYNDCVQTLTSLFSAEEFSVQELSLCTLMKFVKAEGQPVGKDVKKFPVNILQRIILALVQCKIDLSRLIERFKEYLEFDDVRFYTMKVLLSAMSKEKKTSMNLSNLFKMLENLSMPAPTAEELSNHFTSATEGSDYCKCREHKKLFTTLWIMFLKNDLSTTLYKSVLVVLHEKVMPFMTSPLQLADFLTLSYNIGGSVSLLALNGLFILINSYNLNYPDFYGKLYALLEPSIFFVKYRARFFFLLDLFLSSTHIPAYLVAAFIKRLSRLSLTAPPTSLIIVTTMIINLLIRHPNCRVLVHQPNGPTDLTDDPYVDSETDPSKCRAMDSSLWEIQSLQEHYYYAVGSECKKLENILPKAELPLSEVLELSIEEMMDKEKKKKYKEIPTNFTTPSGLSSEFWSLG